MKEINLTRGMVALVDDDDFEYLNQWNWMAFKIKDSYYAARVKHKHRVYDKMILMHRLIMDNPDGFIDHKDRNPLNNRRSNLRLATRSQNGANRKSTGSSNYLGVCVFKNRRSTYIKAGITSQGKNIHLGTFKTEEAAARAYDTAAKELHGEFANLNF